MSFATEETSASDIGRDRPSLASAIRGAAEAARVSLPPDFAGSNGDLSALLRAAREAGLGEAELGRAVAGALGLAFADDLRNRPASLEFVERVPIHFARQHG